MTSLRALTVLALALVTGGCFRTRYYHLEPGATAPSPDARRYARAHSGWQHFFIWGWVPSERVIDAAGECGGPEYVEEIRTRQRFVQGLIEAFAGYYINVYSPWNGEVVCAGSPPDR